MSRHMARQRTFTKPKGQPINDTVVSVEFDFTGERVQAFSITKKGERRQGSNWSLRDAMSLVESGHWVEITPDDEPSSAAELEGGAW